MRKGDLPMVFSTCRSRGRCQLFLKGNIILMNILNYMDFFLDGFPELTDDERTDIDMALLKVIPTRFFDEGDDVEKEINRDPSSSDEEEEKKTK